MRKPGPTATWKRTLPVAGQPVSPERKDRPGHMVCASVKCGQRWPTANPLSGWRCPWCGSETVFEPREES